MPLELFGTDFSAFIVGTDIRTKYAKTHELFLLSLKSGIKTCDLEKTFKCQCCILVVYVQGQEREWKFEMERK